MDAYRALRAVYHCSALQDQPAIVDDDRLVEERALVRGLWRTTFGDEAG
jgi:glutamate-ammonia-ligase adenylyltransferase